MFLCSSKVHPIPGPFIGIKAWLDGWIDEWSTNQYLSVKVKIRLFSILIAYHTHNVTKLYNKDGFPKTESLNLSKSHIFLIALIITHF